jgi:Family of unknown function (DUF6012)
MPVPSPVPTSPFLLHLRPMIYSPYHDVQLKGFDTFPFDGYLNPIDLHPEGPEDDLSARRSPTDREWFVVGRHGRKTHNGILFQFNRFCPRFYLRVRWDLGGLILTHEVDYTISDHTFGAASDYETLWESDEPEMTRYPRWAEQITLKNNLPGFKLPSSPKRKPRPKTTIQKQMFFMPTIKPRKLREIPNAPPISSAIWSNFRG